MYTIILIGVTTIVAVIVVVVAHKDAEYVLGAILGGAIAMAVLLVVSIAAQPTPVYYKESYETIPLVTMKDNQSIVGRISLFGGSINGVMAYSYYTKENNGFIVNQLPASASIIYEESRNDGVLFKNKARLVEVDGWQKDWLIPSDSDRVLYPTDYKTVGYPYEFHVPIGTVKAGFVLDAE